MNMYHNLADCTEFEAQVKMYALLNIDTSNAVVSKYLHFQTAPIAGLVNFYLRNTRQGTKFTRQGTVLSRLSLCTPIYI